MSLLVSVGLLKIFGVPWLVDASPSLCLHFHMALSLCACLSLCPIPLFYKDMDYNLPQWSQLD